MIAMSFTYAMGYGLSPLRKPGKSSPPVVRMILGLSEGNWLYPSGLSNVPGWFLEEDFILRLPAKDIEFTWVVDHWETSDTFLTTSGNGSVVQGSNTTPARYVDAELDTDYITGESRVRITAMGRVYITWSGIDG